MPSSLSGWISRPTSIMGSINASKQFIYVNGRPCDLPKFKKLILDCYRVMNKSQNPAFVVAVYLPKGISRIRLNGIHHVQLQTSLISTSNRISECCYWINSRNCLLSQKRPSWNVFPNADSRRTPEVWIDPLTKYCSRISSCPLFHNHIP